MASCSYSSDAVERDPNGHVMAFRVGGKCPDPCGRRLSVSGAGARYVDLERQLDYARRAEIGRGKQFNKGNYIT